jgi:hypothetical protein
LNSVWQGVLWGELLRQDLPLIELRPPIEEIVERFDRPSAALEPTLRWEVAGEPETPRLWAKSLDGDRILQVQRNALLTNWLRSASSPSSYRRFAERKSEFDGRLAQFRDFLTRDGLIEGASLSPTSCVITYINHIAAETWSAALAQSLTCWNGKCSDVSFPSPEQSRLQWSFAFPEDRGRLHVTASWVVQRETKQQVLQLELPARKALEKEHAGWEDVSTSIQAGHAWIVRGITLLTTPEMHLKWGRVQ